MKGAELGLLINALNIKRSGFYLVEAPNNDTLDDLTVKIKVGIGQHDKVAALIDFLKKSSKKSFSEFIKDVVDENYDAHVFFIRNLETHAGKKPDNFLRQLNQSREVIYALNRNFIFMVYPHFAELFMKYAKDLFSWIPHRYRFDKSHITPREFAASMRLDEKVRFVGDRDRKYILELIKLYEDQLQETVDNPSFKIKNIVEPLADLYSEYDDYAKEIPLREEILQFYQKGPEMEYAGTFLSLGVAYSNLPTGDRTKNLKKAIDCFKEALKIFTIDDSPRDWAGTQNNIGEAYGKLPTGDRDENLRSAIKYYHKAFKVYTEQNYPSDWAMTQNNLGNAYADLPTGDRGENLQRAIVCFEAALRIYTERDFPIQWAVTQNNLGTAYAGLPTGDRGENLQRAIACFEAALRVYTERDFPIGWAMTQNNLGTAYRILPTGDRGENLQRAIACYEAALRVYTKKKFPEKWALVKENIDIAMTEKAEIDKK